MSLPQPTIPVVRNPAALAFGDGESGHLRARPEDPALAVPDFVVQLLLSCDALEPIADHAARFGSQFGGIQGFKFAGVAKSFAESLGPLPKGGSGLDKALVGILQHLTARGHLLTGPELRERLAPLTGTAGTITSMCLPTANRPETLKRALASYLGHFQKHGRKLRVVVGDDSTDPAAVAANAAVIEAARKDFGGQVEHLSRADRPALVEKHAGGDAAKREALEFLLLDADGLGQTYGASRNALLLATRGELVFFADDDTLAELHSARGRSAGVGMLFPGEEPQPLSRWPDRDAAKRSVEAVDADLLALHEKLLGRPPAAAVADALGAEALVSGLVPEIGAALASGWGQIAVTLNGLVGDSGSSMPTILSMLEARGEEAARIFGNGGLAQTVSQSREVVKLGAELRLGANGPCMATFFGFDNRGPLVPFFPHFRREEIPFKELLVRTRGAATLAYLPYALLHAPPGNAPRVLPSVAMSDVFIAALVEVAPAPWGADPAAMLRALGARLAAVGEQPAAAFRRQVLDIAQAGRLHMLSARRRALAELRGKLPGALASEAERTIHTWISQLQGPLVAAEPALVEKLGDGAKAEAATQRLLARFGRAVAALA
ncbi:MAG: hypothetical protein JST54_28840 [Deltaproteobacteria bacterium]|nr:hypothetical protein [Deltaproteobacteria bacterium]